MVRRSAAFCAQPAVYQDGPLYVAYVTGDMDDPEIRFVVGEDQANGTVTFSYLYESLDPSPTLLTVPLHRKRFDDDPVCLPGSFEAKTVPQIAVNPDDPNQLLIAYHDTASDDPNDDAYRDMNVYVHEIAKSGAVWQLGQKVKVNNETTDYESDQFMPSMTVDAGGYVHIAFYDDRRFTDAPEGDLQPDGFARPKFDAYYAWAPVDDLAFENHPNRNELLHIGNPEDPDQPAAFDRTLVWLNPREYNGIAWYGDRIWTAYTGSREDNDPNNNDSLIWSSRIDW
jgi:hypothetical protein